MSFTLNEPGHDTHLYDPDRHDNQIVAVFEDDAAAQRAHDALRSAGVPESAIRLVSAPAAAPAPETTGDQILNAFMGLFTPSSEHHDYAHAVGRGHATVIVTPAGAADRQRIVTVLEQSDPIDFDAKLEEWRQAGYEGREEDSAAERRVGRREPASTGSRVRSYVADRPGMTNATPGVESSGMNSPAAAGGGGGRG